MNTLLNRKLHAIASGIAPGESHEFLKQSAVERFGIQYAEMTEMQMRDLLFHLQGIKNRMRGNIYRALNGAEGSPITEAQISQAKQFQRLLGWSTHSFETMIKNRYNEHSLDTMPSWKAVRLVAYLEKRWHQKQKKANADTQREREKA